MYRMLLANQKGIHRLQKALKTISGCSSLKDYLQALELGAVR
jgi:hypothetical protein